MDQTLFRIDPSAWDCPPLTDHAFAIAEARLGVNLPAAYKAVLQQRNGGWLARPWFPAYLSFLNSIVYVPHLMGVGEYCGLDSNRGGSTMSDWLSKQWDYPLGSVVLSHFGHCGIALLYSDKLGALEPSVIFHYGERYPDVSTVTLASSFADFVSKLTTNAGDSNQDQDFA